MNEADFSIADELAEITEVVRTASRTSLSWYRDLDRATAIENKKAGDDTTVTPPGFDPVTEADRAIETELREALLARFPDHEVLGEEFGLTGESRYRWTIDPIDGTRAFITGQPMWGTLVGLSIDGKPEAGWMHIPPLDETFVGHGATTQWHGQGVTRTLQVSPTDSLADAVVLCTHPTMFAPGVEADGFARVSEAAKMVRYSGDCLNYGLLAMGLADAVVENQLESYDILPLLPIVQGAGGVVTGLDGTVPLEGGFVVAAATEALHQELLETLNG